MTVCSLIARHYRVLVVYFFDINYHNVQYLCAVRQQMHIHTHIHLAGEVLYYTLRLQQHAMKILCPVLLRIIDCNIMAVVSSFKLSSIE